MSKTYQRLCDDINDLSNERCRIYLALSQLPEPRVPDKLALKRLKEIEWQLIILNDQKKRLAGKLHRQRRLQDPLVAGMDEFAERNQVWENEDSDNDLEPRRLVSAEHHRSPHAKRVSDTGV